MFILLYCAVLNVRNNRHTFPTCDKSVPSFQIAHQLPQYDFRRHFLRHSALMTLTNGSDDPETYLACLRSPKQSRLASEAARQLPKQIHQNEIRDVTPCRQMARQVAGRARLSPVLVLEPGAAGPGTGRRQLDVRDSGQCAILVRSRDSEMIV